MGIVSPRERSHRGNAKMCPATIPASFLPFGLPILTNDHGLWSACSTGGWQDVSENRKPSRRPHARLPYSFTMPSGLGCLIEIPVRRSTTSGIGAGLLQISTAALGRSTISSSPSPQANVFLRKVAKYDDIASA